MQLELCQLGRLHYAYKARLLVFSTVKVALELLFGATLGCLSMNAAHGQIYILNNGNGTIGEYNFDGTPVNAQLITGLDGPFAFAQSQDRLFISDGESQAVAEYTTRGTAANLAVVAGLPATGLAVSDSNLFVLSSKIHTIGKYKLDGTVVNAALISSMNNIPVALAVSGSNLFVLNYGMRPQMGGTISEYTTDGALVNASLVSNLSGAHGLTVSGSNLFVADSGKGTIDEYTTSGVPVSTPLISGLKVPLAITAAGPYLFVTCNNATMDKGTVGVYTTSGKRVNDALITGLNNPVGIVVVPTGTEMMIAQQAKPSQTEEPNAGPQYVHPKNIAIAPEPRINLPPVIVDSQNYGTENNWLAHHIALRITTLCYLALHPNSNSVPDFKINAQVDAKAQTVHLTIENFSSSTVACDLNPAFAWDPLGYAPLARQLLGNSLPPSPPATDATSDIVTNLLTPTGPELAKEDMSLSAQVQGQPASAEGNEKAALLLIALALRDRAELYTDYRQILCRATAHLAMADALRQNQAPSWAGEIAEAGILTLSGRETDALAKLDLLAARTDSTEPVKNWLDALRLRAKGDWRIVQIKADSPLLLKIVLAHVFADDLVSIDASHRLDAHAPPAEIPDWGRCALTNLNEVSVETANTFAKPTPELELKELAEILQIEQAPGLDPNDLGGNFSKSLQEDVFSGTPASLHIIGPDMFRDVTRRHLLCEIQATQSWLDTKLGLKEDAKTYLDEIKKDWEGMRLLETINYHVGWINYIETFKEFGQKHFSWEPWEMPMSNLPYSFQPIYPDVHTLHAFYADGLPFGTAYDLFHRQVSLQNGQMLEDDKHPEVYHPPYPGVPHGSSAAFMKLAPDSFTAITLDNPTKDVIRLSMPMWDYNLQPIFWTQSHGIGYLHDIYGEFLQKEAVLYPDAYFTMGDWLRQAGKIDEAAEADRKGFDQGFDQVGMSNSVGPLVDYYYNHGRKDEAEMIAKRAADVYSEQGLMTYTELLEKLGRLDEAEQTALAIQNRYNDSDELTKLYAANPDHFRDHMLKNQQSDTAPSNSEPQSPSQPPPTQEIPKKSPDEKPPETD